MPYVHLLTQGALCICLHVIMYYFWEKTHVCGSA